MGRTGAPLLMLQQATDSDMIPGTARKRVLPKPERKFRINCTKENVGKGDFPHVIHKYSLKATRLRQTAGLSIFVFVFLGCSKGFVADFNLVIHRFNLVIWREMTKLES